MNKIASLGLAALLSFSGCAQKNETIPKPAVTQKTETIKPVTQATQPVLKPTTLPTTIPKIIPKREKSLDEMITSEEQTAYRNADALSRQIPRDFEMETFGEYLVYHETGITLGQAKPDGSPQLNGKGRAVVLRSNTDLLAGYFNYAFPGKEKGLLAKGDEAKDLWRIACVASSDLIALSTGKASFGYTSKDGKWKVMEINMTAFETTEEFTKAMMHEPSEEEKKITDLSKRPIRTKEADLEKVKIYQTIVDRFFAVYTPKQETKEVIKSPNAKSIDKIFKEGEERIYNQAKNVISNPASRNLLKHRLDNGATVYHDPSLVFSGNKMSGSGNYIMQDKDGGVVVAFDNTNVDYSNSPPERQERKGKEKQTSKTLTKTEAKQTPKTEAKPDPRNFLFVYSDNSIILINSDINITYFHIENTGWAKREMNIKEIKPGNEEAYLMEYISKGYDFKNTNWDMPVRSRMIPLTEIEKYVSLKQLVDKAYPQEK